MVAEADEAPDSSWDFSIMRDCDPSFGILLCNYYWIYGSRLNVIDLFYTYIHTYIHTYIYIYIYGYLYLDVFMFVWLITVYETNSN